MWVILEGPVHCDKTMRTYPAGVPVQVPDSWREMMKPSIGRIVEGPGEEDAPDSTDGASDPTDKASLANLARQQQSDTRKRMGPRTKKRA